VGRAIFDFKGNGRVRSANNHVADPRLCNDNGGMGRVTSRIWPTWILLVAAAFPPIAQARCQFAYTDQIRTGIAAPEITRREGALHKGFFDLKNPIVSVRGDSVELLFSPPRSSVDRLDPPYFEMLLLDCGRTLRGSRLTWSPGTGVTGGWIGPGDPWPFGEWDRSAPPRTPPKVALHP
jgi:hypothetical protein